MKLRGAEQAEWGRDADLFGRVIGSLDPCAPWFPWLFCGHPDQKEPIFFLDSCHLESSGGRFWEFLNQNGGR
jgi:hypothetical protein